TVDHYAGSRDILQLEGLRRTLPVTAAAALLAALSMAGIPPFLGFIAKEMIYETKLAAPAINWVFAGMGIFANAATAAVAFIVGIEPFVGKKMPHHRAPHESGWKMWLGPIVLAVTGLLIALTPGY